MPNDAHVLDLLPAYALGSLDDQETHAVEQHLLSCLICRNESNAFQAVAEQLSFAAPTIAPPPDLRDRLMERVRASQPQPRVPVQAPKRPWLERLLPVWGLTSLCVILALTGINLFLWQRLAQPESFRSPEGMRAVPLSAPDTTSKATGFVLISEDGDSGALVVDGLPHLAENQQYQAWLIRDGQRTSGAIFSTDERSYGGTRIRSPRSLLEYSEISITVEPAGGSPQPTGAVVLGGPLIRP